MSPSKRCKLKLSCSLVFTHLCRLATSLLLQHANKSRWMKKCLTFVFNLKAERERGREASHLLVHAPDAGNSQGSRAQARSPAYWQELTTLSRDHCLAGSAQKEAGVRSSSQVPDPAIPIWDADSQTDFPPLIRFILMGSSTLLLLHSILWSCVTQLYKLLQLILHNLSLPAWSLPYQPPSP